MKKKQIKQQRSKRHPFLNKHVLVTLKLMNQKTEYSEEQSMQSVRPVVMGGWFLKDTKNELHLGDTPYEVTIIVNKDVVAYFETMEEPDELNDKLDAFNEGISN